MGKYSAVIFLLLFLLPVSCVDELEAPVLPDCPDGETVICLPFGSASHSKIEISTRATLGRIPESRVSNIFLYVFDAAGKRVFMHYFDDGCLKIEGVVKDWPGNAWWVKNTLDETYGSSDQTHGILRLKVPYIEGGTLCAIANIDADFINVSPEKLNYISSLAELKRLAVSLNQESVSRNGYFPMTGYMDAVSIGDGGIFYGGQPARLEFERLDAQVHVNVRVADGNEVFIEGEGDAPDSTYRLKDFKPETWQVINLPKVTRVIPDHSAAVQNSPEYFFNTTPTHFETNEVKDFTYVDDKGVSHTVSSPIHGFSFYMIENLQESKTTVGGDYHKRDLRLKNPLTGEYLVSQGDMWKHAPEYGTYIVIEGEVVMDVDVSSEAKDQQLSADVRYIVHLGDFASDKDNYDVLRNTFYTYNITIKGVNNIELEVETSNPSAPGDVQEKDSGAMGQVNIAKESIYTFDAHYGQRVFCFDSEAVEDENVSWFVRTPFGLEGIPPKIDGVDVPTGYDYKWVHFLVNDPADGDIRNNRWYPGDDSDRLMDVVQFCAYMKEQKRLLKTGLPNDFQDEYDRTWADKFPGQPELANRKRIYVTVFVDEFYYDEHPISGEKDPQLWKQFVNCDNRVMFILCDNKESLDRDSDATGSIVTIRQRSIQTPYSLQKPELIRAWGAEQIDETAGTMRFFNRKEEDRTANDISARYPMGGIAESTTEGNGLYNTAVVWDIVRNGSVVSGVRWDDYLEYYRENDSPHFFMVDADDKAVGRYSCMMRNRDKDGDREIDGNEVEWYLASVNQIFGLFFGEQGLTPISSIYPESFKKAGTVAGGPFDGNDGWRNHITTSTVGYNGTPVDPQHRYQPKDIWAEEGLSVGFYRSTGGKFAVNTVRCLRNLGEYEVDDRPASIADPSANLPEELVSVTKDAGAVTPQTVYTFDCTNVNSASLRFFTSRELEPMDEYSEMARLPERFETGEFKFLGMEYMNTGNPDDLTSGYRGMLLGGGSPCPEGYRMPNLREAGLMYYLCNDNAWWSGGPTHVCNYYSLALKDLKPDGTWNSSGSWSINNDLFTVATSTNGVRCVRDIR